MAKGNAGNRKAAASAPARNAGRVEWDAIAKERATGVPAAEPDLGQPQDAQADSDGSQNDLIAQLRDRITKLETRTRNAEGHIGGLNHNHRLLHGAMQAAATAARQKAAAATAGGNAARKSVNANQLAPEAIGVLVQQHVAAHGARMRRDAVHTTLDAVYPDWQNDVKTEHFARWMNTQADEIKALAASNAVRDAARMLSLYEAAKSQGNYAAPLTAARRQKLAAAVGGPKGVRVPPVKSESDMTPAELWELEAKRRERARGLT